MYVLTTYKCINVKSSHSRVCRKHIYWLTILTFPYTARDPTTPAVPSLTQAQ